MPNQMSYGRADRYQIELDSGEVLPLANVFLADERHRDFAIAVSNRLPLDSLHRLFFWMIPFLLIGLGFLIPGVLAQRADHKLGQNGITIQGKITAMERTDDMEGVQSHFLTYQFKVAGEATPYSRRQYVSQDTFMSSSGIGQEVTITYLPDDPHHSQLIFDSAEDEGNAIKLRAGLAITFIIVGLMLPLLGGLLRHYLLLKRGHLIKGEIVSSTVQRNAPSFGLSLRFKFRSPGSQKEIRAGWSGLHGELDETELPAVGTAVVILYFNDNVYKLL